MDYTSLRIAGYVRVSTEEQAIHGLSVEAQTDALKQWAKGHSAHLTALYTDAGISGRKKVSKRPALSQLLTDVEAGRLDLVIFTKLDRWFRNIAEYYKVQDILEQYHVNWKTIHEDYDTSTASGRLKINIMLSVAQDEADRTSERIKAVFDHKRERGETLGGRPPKGYRFENGHLALDPEWQPTMELFFRTYFERWSIIEARTAVQNETGKVIPYQTARLLLKNEIYAGTLYGIPDACPAYITREQFAAIQELKKRSTHQTKTDRVYLFTGLLFCGECGGRLQVGCTRKKRSYGEYIQTFYHCVRHQYNGLACSNKYCLTEKKLERYLLDHIERELQVRAEELALKAAQAPDTTAITAELDRLRRKLARLKALYLEELITLEEFRETKATMDHKMSELERQYLDQPQKVDLTPVQAVLSEGWKTLYRELPQVEKQRFWRKVLSKVSIGTDHTIHVYFLGE